MRFVFDSDVPAMPVIASDAQYFTSISLSIFNLSKIGFTCGWITAWSNCGAIFCRVLATLNLTFATWKIIKYWKYCCFFTVDCFKLNNCFELLRRNKHTMTTEIHITNFAVESFRITFYNSRNLTFRTQSLGTGFFSYLHRSRCLCRWQENVTNKYS